MKTKGTESLERRAVKKATTELEYAHKIPLEQTINFADKNMNARDGGSASGSSMTNDAANQTRQSVSVTDNKCNVEYRVKMIEHGNQRAGDEILMQKFYELIPGTNSPHTLFGINFQNRREFGALQTLKSDYSDNKKMGIPQYFVASPMTKKPFYDLGNFLIDTARHIIPEEFRIAKDEKGEILPMSEFDNYHLDSRYGKLRTKSINTNGNKAEDKIKRRNVLFEIYDLLPQEIKNKFDVTYYNSQWIANWDFLNFSLYNTGFTYDSSAQNLDDQFIPTIVDFGNCGPTGFGGLYKEESLFRANMPAKPQPENTKNRGPSLDYDPEVPHTYGIDGQPSTIVSLHKTPRTAPFAGLLKNQLKEQFFNYETSTKMSDEALESAYSLLLVSDQAIDRVVEKWNFVGDKKPIPFLKLSPKDFDKIYPPAAIKEVLSIVADEKNLDGGVDMKDQDDNNDQVRRDKILAKKGELWNKYSYDAFKELYAQLKQITSGLELGADQYFDDSEPNKVIMDQLLDVTNVRRIKLNEKYYFPENMKKMMKERRNNFISQFPSKDIFDWEKRNQERADFLKNDAIERTLKRDKNKAEGVGLEEKDWVAEQLSVKTARTEVCKSLDELRKEHLSFTYPSGSRDI